MGPEETTDSELVGGGSAASLEMVTGLTLDLIVNEMINKLLPYLPAPVPSLPNPNVTLVSLQEKVVGLGNRRGNESRGAFGIVELKGTRLDTTVRFEIWAQTSNNAENAMTTLNLQIMGDKNSLFTQGFLKIILQNSDPAEFVNSVNGWRKQADYQILYEFRFSDTDGAHSLLARIPVYTDPETANSPFRETNVVTDEMVRWDNETAPLLCLRGKTNIRLLSMLLFVSDATPVDGVTLLRTYEGAAGPPTSYPTLTDFLNAINDPLNPDRHAQLTFATFSDFLNEFTSEGAAVELGDWDVNTIPDSYSAYVLAFTDAIKLPDALDKFEINLNSASFSEIAVMYLKASTL
ncbi:MAG: hypothetical protein Kow0042_26130 [Calditrichia bacterium]